MQINYVLILFFIHLFVMASARVDSSDPSSLQAEKVLLYWVYYKFRISNSIWAHA